MYAARHLLTVAVDVSISNAPYGAFFFGQVRLKVKRHFNRTMLGYARLS